MPRVCELFHGVAFWVLFNECHAFPEQADRFLVRPLDSTTLEKDPGFTRTPLRDLQNLRVITLGDLFHSADLFFHFLSFHCLPSPCVAGLRPFVYVPIVHYVRISVNKENAFCAFFFVVRFFWVWCKVWKPTNPRGKT